MYILRTTRKLPFEPHGNLLLKRRPRLRAAAWATWTVAFGTGLVLARLPWAHGDLIEFPMFAACGYTAVAAAWAAVLMWAVTRSGGRDWICPILRCRIRQRIGTLSYMAYLPHFGILGALVAAMPRAPHLAAAAVALVLSLRVAEASWRCFRKPDFGAQSRCAVFLPAAGRAGGRGRLSRWTC